MQNNTFSLALLLLVLFVSCDKESNLFDDYLVARPIKMNLSEFKSSVAVSSPVPITNAGKIYAYEEYVFVNDKHKGIHVIDNTDPASPQKIAFINIPGNVDIAIKNSYLYADSKKDLVVLDISDINNIKSVNRLENVLFDFVFFPTADFYEYDGIDYETELVLGWEVTTERRLVSEYESRWGGGVLFAENDGAVNAPAPTNSGQGGSLARFKIVDDYLYAVDSHNINVFNIQNLDSPQSLPSVYAGFDIETIFNKDEHLFLGSMQGMYIYDISDPAAPNFVSEFQHGTACDPVVVDENYAYVTLRGGSLCGATESGLFIVDISTISNPTLATSYAMDNPYGLGIKDEKLFICDGDAGLKVYDKTDINDLKKIDHFQNINTFDVIPLQEHLLMIGDGVLYQYNYESDGIELISAMSLD